MLPVGDPCNLQVPAASSKPTGRFVKFDLAAGRFVKARWTFRPVGGWTVRDAHRAHEREGERRACGAQTVPIRKPVKREVVTSPIWRPVARDPGCATGEPPDQAGLERKEPG